MNVAGMILGAGLGSRLGELTADTPKPLLELCGEPLLGHVLGRVFEAGVTQVYINLHYRADQILEFIKSRPTPVPVHARTEPRLTGPAGALRLFSDELRRHDAVLVVSSDVIVGESLRRLVETHATRPTLLTFACTQVREAYRYGVLDIGSDQDVRAAQEKPDVPRDELRWISAGVYCLDPELIDWIPANQVYDFARDLAPALIGAGARVGAHCLAGYWRDVGTPSAYSAARQDAAQGLIPWLTPGPQS